MTVEGLLGFSGKIHVADIGAAAVAEVPPYKTLLDRGIARLTAVDGDERQREKIVAAFGPDAIVLCEVIGDGARHTLHLCSPASGMSSLLQPSKRNLAFFNGFPGFGAVQDTVEVETKRLADIADLQQIDFLKMDIQGAELMVLEHAGSALDRCVAIQLEASFVPLYEDQPSFGALDLWMRAHGFLPHCFTDVKRWSIAPVVRGGNIRIPFNQLLECDIVYVRGLVALDGLDDDQMKKLALIAGYSYRSPDLAVRIVLELERRGTLPSGIFREAGALLSALGR